MKSIGLIQGTALAISLSVSGLVQADNITSRDDLFGYRHIGDGARITSVETAGPADQAARHAIRADRITSRDDLFGYRAVGDVGRTATDETAGSADRAPRHAIQKDNITSRDDLFG